MACVVGAESYLALMDEGDWGQFPGSSGSGSIGTYYHVPVLDYNVMATRLRRFSAAYTGTHQKKHGQAYGADVAGQLVTNLHGWKPPAVSISLAEKMLTWAFGDFETDDVASKSAEWAEGPNVSNRRHTGLRVNTATLLATAQSGEVQLTMALIGKEEYSLAMAQTLPVDREKIVDMQATEITLVLNGVTVLPTVLQHQVGRNLRPLRTMGVGGWWITSLCAGMRDETLTLTLPKEAATWDNYRRLQNADTEVTATLTMQGLHNGTGASLNYTKLTRVFNRLYFEDQQLEGGKEVLLQPLTFQCLKPDSSSNTHTDTWSEV